jgi:polygalacturonase
MEMLPTALVMVLLRDITQTHLMVCHGIIRSRCTGFILSIVSVSDLTIEDSIVHNQDDCLAINKGSNIIFQRNSCTGGHGISVGSIDSDVTVSNVQILNNVVTDNDQGLRIKTKSAATG